MGRWKILIGVVLILAAFSWLALSGFEEGKAYYKTVDELKGMRMQPFGKRLRVAGTVVPGSILFSESAVDFVLEHQGVSLAIHYVGRSPLPDSFKEGVDAVAEGKLESPEHFRAQKVQAKCASKYDRGGEEK